MNLATMYDDDDKSILYKFYHKLGMILRDYVVQVPYHLGIVPLLSSHRKTIIILPHLPVHEVMC